MPQLTLVNNLSSNYHPRTRIVDVDENFSRTSGGFVEVNTRQIIASKRLKINAIATEGYSKNNWYSPRYGTIIKRSFYNRSW